MPEKKKTTADSNRYIHAYSRRGKQKMTSGCTCSNRSGGTDANTAANQVEEEEEQQSKQKQGCSCDEADRRDSSRDEGGQLPEKRVLQLVIDILQRRDTYEIFAEPVDPNEVEDYYEIVKEPMDFGTMRAKLHEGMYQNLDQFKHDVFLITRNAMHFNSSTTIFFRQARAIHELAKRIFHVLMTSPQNFELKFPSTRRRSTRRTTPAATTFPNTTTSSVSSVNARRGRSLTRRRIRSNLTLQTKRKNNYGSQTGILDDEKSNPVEINRRCTYKPNSCDDNDPFGLRSFLSNAIVIPDISYTKSLLSFVKDLGPTAQRIANQKIQRMAESCPNSLSQTNLSSYAAPPNHPNDEFKRATSSRMSLFGNVGRVGGGKEEDYINARSVKENEKVMMQNHHHGRMRKEFWMEDEEEENVRGAIPVVLALEHSNANNAHQNGNAAANEWKLKKQKMGSNRSGELVPSQSKQSSNASQQTNKNDGERNSLCTFVTAPMQNLQTAEEPSKKGTAMEGEIASNPYTFTLGFLKAQLNQMNRNA
ncbi:OLC1v1013805C1 [Oldenlandia corymbosa var. corymbosa]|uniref:OLC1v1013805C1 n=1 Tax=Oldenlandia corymbosa var. corymbosa TaxID=529605 RepID=A0AAV1DZL7_OLDCO|nr:OLC1v1013805C1 [Oldenlandia corymbosa var. corymbosa]